MPPSDSPDGDDVSPEPTASPKASTASSKKAKDDKKDRTTTASNDPATPSRKSPTGTPKSAPAAHQRQRSNSKKHPEPTLLTDFLLGRPSPARLAAERERRKSVDAVRAELRHEMKQSAVRRVQPPGGVRDRVKAWQKANAAAGDAAPDDAATEPTDVAFAGEEAAESVTEEDRVRIKMRQKKKNVLKVKPTVSKSQGTSPSSKPGDDPAAASTSHPKKRVVSDDNWMKPKNRRGPQRRVSPLSRRSSPSSGSGGGKIPKDFTLRTAPSPRVSSRIREWAEKVDESETTTPSRPRSYTSSKSRARSVLSDGTETDMTALSEGADSSSQITARQSLRPRLPGSGSDDRIRIKAVRRKKEGEKDVESSNAPLNGTRQRSKTLPSSHGSRIENVQEHPNTAKSTDRTRMKQSESAEDAHAHDSEPLADTPTKRKSSRSRPGPKGRPKSYHNGATRTRDDASWIEDGGSNVNGSQLLGSDLASSLANRSIADLPGEIPFGNSAFTELDLPLDGPPRSRPKRFKTESSSGFKGVPGVFKKVMEEGKKMINDINEPPRMPMPPSNKPATIEKWLSTTVDPFVDRPKKEMDTATQRPEHSPKSAATPEGGEKGAEPTSTTDKKDELEVVTRASPGYSDKDKSRRISSSEGRTTSQHSQTRADHGEDVPTTPPGASQESPRSDGTTPRAKASGSTSLARRSAIRATSSPRSGDKPQFLDFFREAFHGESADLGGHGRHRDQEQRRYEGDRAAHNGRGEHGSNSSYDEPPASQDPSPAESADASAPKMTGPRFRPPTRGDHELSTIMSEVDSSAAESDLTSDVSRSTMTQSTTLTKDSDLSKSKSKRQEPGLKRRLTKHSDLVSVLSLPDDKSIPNTIKSTRSRPSQRRARGPADRASPEELLKEFSDDEGLYMRELKTLVDGVVPVLLSQVVQGGSSPADLFGTQSAGKHLDSLSKSVVGMGVALEKLNNAHKKAPHHDVRRLANWAHGVVPIYSSYLSSWRLGFQDLIVNLAPAETPEEEDSLIDALPRNDNGDIINENGERVDVAHLLKRPLIRIKHLAKLIECLDSMISSEDTNELVKNFHDLQNKARRRHREETARLTDEEATNTDTTRSRDIRTFDALESVTIDPKRQVNAKDVFSLDLAHSNGQRLECQVELVHRDCQRDPSDPGDLLIRETGDGHRSYLLFAPISVSSISARTGEANSDMVVMIRGTHHDRPWHELLTLSSNNEDQILDWLDILPLTPVPPREPEPSIVDEDEYTRPVDIPVGARSIRRKSRTERNSSSQSPTTHERSLFSKYHPRGSRLPSTPPRIPEEEMAQDRTPTQHDYRTSRDAERSRPLHEDMRPDPQRLTNRPEQKPFREDGAPPPPIHRTFGNGDKQHTEQNSPKTPIKPPTELKSDGRVRRRTSSPLKHEYLPSDGSSASEISAQSGSDVEGSDSDDEIESIDVPETELGFSIKDGETNDDTKRKPPQVHVESLLALSDCSLTPSNSASQAGLAGPKLAPEVENATRYMATVSRWSDKGSWRELTTEPCFIIVTPGLIEAHRIQANNAPRDPQDPKANQPLLAMDLTPLVLIRQSTTVDLEIRSSLQPHCKLSETYGGGNFRFRCNNGPDCFSLYMSVHHARLNNRKFIQLENEARFKSFGERQPPVDKDGDTSSHRRSWFGRKNSYRSSVRAPSQSQDAASSTPSSSISASSFLKRITVAGNLSFNLARSSVDKQSRPGSVRNSLYTESSSGTPPRSPSISMNSVHNPMSSESIRIRLHLLVAAAKWEDFGNCVLQVRRPPPGWHQALRADHGMEKRVTVTSLPRKESDQPKILLDAVLGSGCFSPMGSRGVVCGVWEEVRDSDGVVGSVPATGNTGGNIKKWCFQFASAAEASWVLRLVHQEVLRV